MKNLLSATLLSLALVAAAQAQDRPTISPQSKLILAEAATAMVLGPVIVPVAAFSGNIKGLCEALEPKRPGFKSSYDPNSVGRDQCPKGNWLRAIPLVRDFISNQGE